MKKIRARYVVAAAILCLIAGGSLYVLSKYRAQIEDAKHKLAILNADYSSKQNTRAAMALRHVQAILADATSRSGALSENASLPFRGAKNVTWCVYARAVEIAFKRTDLQDGVRDAMQPTGDLLHATCKKILVELYLFRMESFDAAAMLRLGTRRLSNEADIPPPYIPALSIEAGIQGTAAFKALAAASNTVEIAATRDTMSAIVAAVDVMAGREAVLLTSAGTLAEVPIADLIAAAAADGKTACTTADINAAVQHQEALPGAIKRTTDAQLDELGAGARKFIATFEANTTAPVPSKDL